MSATPPAARIQEPARAVPHPGGVEVSALLDSVLSEYGWPSNPKNAARAGWTAAMRYLALTQEPARAREWLTPPPSWRRLAKAAIDLLWAIDEKHDSQKPPLKYSVPYGAVNGLRIALCAAEDPAAPTTNEINDLPANIEDSPAAIAHTQQPAAAQAKSEAVAEMVVARLFHEYENSAKEDTVGYLHSWCLMHAASLTLPEGRYPLYAAPQQEAERQPLSEDAISDITDRLEESPTSLAHAKHDDIVALARAIEAAHGITGPATQETKHG